METKRVVVLGAGISGLSTATLLLQQEKGFDVHLVAKHFPGDSSGEYSSPWAAAHWRSAAMNDDDRQKEFDRETFNHFWEIAKTPQNKAGVMVIDEFNYWERLPQNFSDPWFKTMCPEYRHLRKEELPAGIEFGATFKTVSVNAPTYLNYLLDIFTSLGGTTQRANISHLNGCIESDTDIVINCSGLHARTLGGVEDPDVYAARGLTVVTQLPQVQRRSFLIYPAGSKTGSLVDSNTEMTYVIPRDDGEVILGGCYEEHNYSTEIDNDVAAGVVQRCLAICPDLLPRGQAKLNVKRIGVGLRPSRKGGIRIDAEWITSEKFNKRVLVCHNYGHGGIGFQSCHGTAQRVIKVMKEMSESKSADGLV